MNNFFLTAGLIFALLPFDCAAQFDLREAGYIDVSVNNVMFSGSYEGDGYIIADNDIVLIPKLTPGGGLGIAFGLCGAHAPCTFEFAYRINFSECTTMYEEIKGRATTHVIQLVGIKWYIPRASFEKTRVKLFLDFDLSFVTTRCKKVTFEDGIVGVDEKGHPANFKAFAFGGGAGLQLMITDNLALYAKTKPEWHVAAGLKPKGSDRYTIEDKFNNLMLLNCIGLTLYMR